MINQTCFKCKRHFELDPVFVGFELGKLKKDNATYYQAICPACRAINKVSVSQMQTELDSVQEEVKTMLAEAEQRKVEAKTEQQAKNREKAKAKADKKK